ncbi:MAG: Omp28-related outer membrane protein [Crocinitomicaceae bacterium]|nr:Omp28-related outer membrane protein [Crocinitomicaceae bacterium]
MKKLLLCGSLLVAGSAISQYSEDFEGTSGTALPAGWTQVSAATDAGYITTTDYTSTYFAFPAHTRYAGTNDDICNCDKSNEKLISEAIAVGTGTQILGFDYILGAYYGEFANIGISTDGGTTVVDLGTLDATNGSGAHEWTYWSADISAYAGSTVNLVWTYNDNADWGSGLMIDDVSIFSPAAVDMEMIAFTTNPTVVAGMVDITGTVASNGGSNIASFDITWDGTNSASFSPAGGLNYGDTYNFTHTVQLNAAAGSTYNFDVCVVATSDADASNDCLAASVSAVSSVPTKVTVGEEKTGEWCGWCPRGAVALAEMELSNPNDFIGIAVHNGDPMVVASYDGNIGTYVPGGYPGAGVDRVEEGDPSNFSGMHAARVGMIAPAAVGVVMSYSGTNVTITVTADFVGGLSGDYRLAAVLTENNVTGTGQSNYYDDGASGALQYPNTGSMPNFDWVGGGATVSPVWHDHVARALGDDQINGAPGSLPATITAGQTLSHTYTFPQDAAWDMTNAHAVGMLVNGSTGEILNAGGVPLNAIDEVATIDFDVNVAPNPTNGLASIKIDLDEAAEVSVVVLDIVGNEVFNSGSSNLAAGSFTSSVDLSASADGVYFAKVSVNGSVKTVKISLAK